MMDAHNKALYESVRADHPGIPAWDDLTEEQKSRMREAMREANAEYTGFMNDLGNEIRASARKERQT